MISQLENKIANKTAKCAVIGMGYVGLPLAMEFAAKGYKVYGVDIAKEKINNLKAGVSYIVDIRSSDIKKLVTAKKLVPTWDFAVLSESDMIIVCVPTPLAKTKEPDMSFIISAADEIKKHLRSGQLIVLESTTYPGTTDEVLLSMFEETGLKAGKDFFLAFSPERIDPSNPKFVTKNIPKIMGGVTPVCTKIAMKFYSKVIDRLVEVSSSKVAEMAKLYENTFRSVNIALANELCLICDKLGVDVWEVIDAASTKPFGFMPFYPGPGIGGHCIPVDPYYLTWKSRVYGFDPRFIELAAEVNHGMPEYVVGRIQDILNDRKKSI
ncbi:MAG: nucleotide sugar dehydrogenase, partial [Candidatus Omnitrophica bacterium]|nr:nucleotide sugar dehydrogenase [Candidatus Omnitrophota bacterium]